MSLPVNVNGNHKVVTLEVQGRAPMRVLCLQQKDGSDDNAYYVLAECGGTALKWRSMIKDNAVRRLRDEFIPSITREEDADSLDVEAIFFCAAEVPGA